MKGPWLVGGRQARGADRLALTYFCSDGFCEDFVTRVDMDERDEENDACTRTLE
jgi:hypothetical protein